MLAGIKTLEYRGYDSWGIAVVDKNSGASKIKFKKKSGKIGGANVTDLPASNFAFGHTRWATHGGVTDINAHPHFDCSGDIAVIHNGIVENYLELKSELSSEHKYISETDTEVIAHLIEELTGKHTFKEAVEIVFKRLLGRNAIIVMSEADNSLVVAKNGSPIILGIGENESLVASDASALLPYTKKVIFLEDEQIASIDEKHIDVFSLVTGNKINPKISVLNWKIEQAEKGNYPHFLLKEIMEQGKSIAQSVNQNKNDIEKLADLIRKSPETYFVGCGTAGHACRAAAYIFSVIAQKHINFCVGSEFSYLEDFITEKSLLVAVSQSGETADILEAVGAAKRHNAKIASLVNVAGSSLTRVSDLVLPLKVGPEKAVLSTKAFTGKLAIFYLLAYTLTGKYSYGKDLLLKTAYEVDKLLTDKKFHDNLKDIADRIYQRQDIYIIGRGLSFPTALEAAHKIKEASYIHAEGFAGGEPKHCEISLISDDIPCIVFVPHDETKAAILSNAMEFKARGGMIIGISPKKELVFDEWIKVPDSGITSSIIQVIPAQLLAYFLALRRGNDPDKPRNLAKSVTVK